VSLLDTIETGIKVPAIKINVAGTDGIGKTTFASHAPRPVFVKTEEGTNFLDVSSFPLCKSYDDIVKQLQTLNMITKPWCLIPLTGLRNLCNKKFATCIQLSPLSH
jgi:hypothetical protein